MKNKDDHGAGLSAGLTIPDVAESVPASEWERATREVEAIQELYDATTLLQTTMAFVNDSAGLLSPELNYAERRLMCARASLRHLGIITHADADKLAMPSLPPPYDQEHPAVQRQRVRKRDTQ